MFCNSLTLVVNTVNVLSLLLNFVIQDSAHKEVNISLIQEAQKKKQMKQVIFVKLSIIIFFFRCVLPFPRLLFLCI